MCIPVQCDHTKDEDIQKVFERIKKEQHGKLDLLVNNAFSAISVSVINNHIQFEYFIFIFLHLRKFFLVRFESEQLITISAPEVMDTKNFDLLAK